jgi:peptidoglycan DL-endopeptidase CwlO
VLDLGPTFQIGFRFVVTPLTLQIRRNAAKLLAATLTAVTAVALVVPPAGADQAQQSYQLSTERVEAQNLASQISALGQREAALGEQYDAGVASLQQANAQVLGATRALTSAKASQAKTVVLLRVDAVSAYVGGGPQVELAGAVPLANLNAALLRQELEETFASDQTDALDSYRLAAAQESTARAQLELARDAAATRVTQLESDRNQVEAAQNKLVGMQQQVRGEIATLVVEIQREQLLAEQEAEAARLARERAQQEAEAAAAAAAQQVEQAAAAAKQQAEAAAAAALAAATRDAARQAAALPVATTAPTATTVQAQSADSTLPAATTTTTAPTTTYQVPGVSSAASAAVQAAESRVGDPYVWGAAGPSAFDCSGLVMWAYAQAGVDLPHFSGAQYDDTMHIPMSDLEPGDLVFPADPGEHVAMYIGNGEIVQAPYTGADVQIVPLTGWFVLASRVG